MIYWDDRDVVMLACAPFNIHDILNVIHLDARNGGSNSVDPLFLFLWYYFGSILRKFEANGNFIGRHSPSPKNRFFLCQNPFIILQSVYHVLFLTCIG